LLDFIDNIIYTVKLYKKLELRQERQSVYVGPRQISPQLELHSLHSLFYKFLKYLFGHSDLQVLLKKNNVPLQERHSID
jgi:hypothetical protein